MLRLGGPGSRPRVLGADLGDTDPAPLLPNISEYDFGRREGQGHLNTFPAGVPSPRSSNGAVFGIANTSPVKRHRPSQRHLTSAHPSPTISTRQLGLLIAGQQPCNQLKLNAIQTKGVYRWLSLPHSTTASWCAVYKKPKPPAAEPSYRVRRKRARRR